MNYLHIYEDQAPNGSQDFVTDGIAFVLDGKTVRGFYRPLAEFEHREQAAVLNFDDDKIAIMAVPLQRKDDTDGARRLLKRMATAWLSGDPLSADCEVLPGGCETLGGQPFDVETLREEALKHGSLPV